MGVRMDQLRSVGQSAWLGHRYNNIQALRAFAAFCVAAYHSNVYIEHFVGPTPFGLFFTKQWGFYGVAIFFAISGFLMGTLIHRNDAWTFILHRAIRIYPAYYIAVVISVLAMQLVPWRQVVSFTGLLLVPGPQNAGVLGIEWTLVFEAMYYAILFAFLAVGRARWVEPFAVLWLAAILIKTLVYPETVGQYIPPLSTMFFFSMNVAFAGGLLLPRLMKMAMLWPFALIIGVPMAAVTMHSDLQIFRWAGGLSCVLLVGAVAQLPQIKGGNLLSRAAIRFGDWSYVTYLVHCTVFWLLFQAFQGYEHPTRIWALGLALVVAVTLALGPLDVVLYRLLRDRTNNTPMERRKVYGWIYMAAFATACLAVAL